MDTFLVHLNIVSHSELFFVAKNFCLLLCEFPLRFLLPFAVLLCMQHFACLYVGLFNKCLSSDRSVNFVCLGALPCEELYYFLLVIEINIYNVEFHGLTHSHT